MLMSTYIFPAFRFRQHLRSHNFQEPHVPYPASRIWPLAGAYFVHNASDIIFQEEYLKERMPARVRTSRGAHCLFQLRLKLWRHTSSKGFRGCLEEYVQENILLPPGYEKTPLCSLLRLIWLHRLPAVTFTGIMLSEEPFEFLQVWPAGSMSSPLRIWQSS